MYTQKYTYVHTEIYVFHQQHSRTSAWMFETMMASKPGDMLLPFAPSTPDEGVDTVDVAVDEAAAAAVEEGEEVEEAAVGKAFTCLLGRRVAA